MEDASLTSIVGVLSVLVLVLANGFFVASEFSLVAVRRSRVSQLVAQGRRSASVLARAVEKLDLNLAACQLGITISSLALGWIGEPALADLFEPFLPNFLGLHANFGAHGIAIGIAFILITALHIVVGELAPKSLALQRTEQTALLVVRPLAVFTFIFKPAIAFLNWLGNLVLRLVGLRPASGQETLHSPEEIRLLVAESQEAGLLHRTQQDVVERVISISNREVSDIMTPRGDIEWADANDSLEEVLRAIRNCRHEQLILARGSVDEIVGVISKQDLLDQVIDGNSLDPVAVVHQPLVLPETIPILRTFERFKSQPVRMAVIVDEYGLIKGIVRRSEATFPMWERNPKLSSEAMARSLLTPGWQPTRPLFASASLEDPKASTRHWQALRFFGLAGYRS